MWYFTALSDMCLIQRKALRKGSPEKSTYLLIITYSAFEKLKFVMRKIFGAVEYFTLKCGLKNQHV